MKPVLALIIPSVLLAACGASETTVITFDDKPDGPTGENTAIYENFPDSSTPGITTLEGVSHSINGDGSKSFGPIKSSLNRDSGAFKFDNGRYQLVDDTGFSSAVATDGPAELKLNDIFSGSYKYMRRYEMIINRDEIDIVVGVLGNPTRASDLPSTGLATYTGMGEVDYGIPVTQLSGNNIPGNIPVPPETYLGKGEATILANFANGKVDVETTNMSFIETTGGNNTNVSDPYFDKVKLTGMEIQGTTFAGGVIEYTKNNITVDPIGANSQFNAAGQFYGAKNSNTGTPIPAEVGGVSHDSGEDGVVTFIFMGD